ncbi:MAG: thioredoxin family protein [Gemmatimonadetes bacterium]|nr:thioredoxin family protein [Gemmatimonadota bacterium]
MTSDATDRFYSVVRKQIAERWASITFVAFMAVVFGLTIGTLTASAGNGTTDGAVNAPDDATVDGAGEATEKPAEPDWQRFDRALALAKDAGKLIVVNFYTDWCPNCRRMNEKTYRDDAVLKQLSKSFIPVKLNAESSQPLMIEGRTLTEYQVALIFRVNSYPTTWFLTSEGRPLLPVRGYYDPDLFAPMLRFVEGGWYEKMDFDMYMEREKRGEK